MRIFQAPPLTPRLAALLAAGVVVLADMAPRITFTHLLNTPFVLGAYGNKFLSRADFNGDGRDDLLIGGDNPHSLDKTPIYLLVSQGNGTFRDATSEVILGTPNAAAPLGVTADFNADGRPDVAVIDAGNIERGQAGTGGYYGEEPILLLSTPDGHLTMSDALALAVLDAERRLYANPGRELHAKYASAGDIDNDGDIDLFVESGGGFENLPPHFMINNADGSFTADFSDARISQRMLVGDSGRWRHDANELADMDGDGALDLLLGQLRRINNQQDGLRSKVIFNDGSGHFREANTVHLPLPDFNDGWAYAGSILAADVNGDGRRDIAIAYTRGQNDLTPNATTLMGRYIQILIGQGNRSFTDESAARMGSQAATMTPTSPVYGFNIASLRGMKHVDVNGDGFADLVMGLSVAAVGPEAPLIHLGDGAGVFSTMDPNLFTGGQTYFGEYALPIDLDGDGLLDFAHSDLLPGPDGVYNTGDERSRIISTLAVGPPPVCSVQVASSSQSFTAAGGVGSATVTTTSACGWTASSQSAWIEVSAPASGTGTGTIGFTVAPRIGFAPRSGTISIGGRTIVVVQQGARTCTYDVDAAALGNLGSAASTTVVTATARENDATCGWTADAGGVPWASVSPTAGLGSSGQISVSVVANTSTIARTGTLALAGSSVSISQQGVPVPPVPMPPRSMWATVDGFAVALSWLPPSGGAAVTGYIVEASLQEAGPAVASVPTGMQMRLNVTAPAGRFFVAARAQTTAGLSGRSNPFEIVVPGCTGLTAPSGLTAAVNGSEVILSWSATPGATAYLVRVGSATGLSNLATVAMAANGLTARAPDGRYHIRVQAQNRCMLSEASSEIVVTVGTPVVVPGAPLNFAFTVTGRDVAFAWSAPATGSAPTGYVLEAGSAPGLADLAVLTLGPAASYAAAGVPPGTYYVRVRAMNAAGSGPPSAEAAVVIR
jgi:hypothetical protein